MIKFVIPIIKILAIVIASTVICWIILPYITYNEFFLESIGFNFFYFSMPALFSSILVLFTYFLKGDHFISRAILWNIAVVYMISAILSSWIPHCNSTMDPSLKYVIINHILVLPALFFLLKKVIDLDNIQKIIFLFSSFLVLLDLHYLFYSLYLVGPFLY